MKLLKNDAGNKIAWQGVLLSVQPRIRLTRSFDQRSHAYLGYALKVRGTVGTEAREFSRRGRARRAHQTPLSSQERVIR